MNTLRHLACIMDGNRRWASARGMPAWMGHRQGVQAVNRVVDFCLEQAISHVSFYLFSQENMQRSGEEKTYLYTTIVSEADRLIHDAQGKGVRVRFVGDRDLFPTMVCAAINAIEQSTAQGDRLTVDLLFCYSGQQEIVHAMRTLARAVERGELRSQDITRELCEQSLWTYPTPPPDLILRTGGFSRLSGFHLYHAAYAELYFLECLWPDLQKEDLQKVVDRFYTCTRRFGI
jgi:undecaprenyl diphosphate synthase